MWTKHETKIADHFEYFRDAAGTFIGWIIQFSAKEPIYACGLVKGTLGKFDSFGEAKDVVEELL